VTPDSGDAAVWGDTPRPQSPWGPGFWSKGPNESGLVLCHSNAKGLGAGYSLGVTPGGGVLGFGCWLVSCRSVVGCQLEGV
jgi:hypothetical protein